VQRAIENVSDQHYPCIEHIIIDGGSTDGSVAVLQQYPNIRWISEQDSGQANALNKGFRMARGDIIGWLNIDDTYTPDAINHAVSFLNVHPDCDIVYGDCNILREDGSLLTVFKSRQTQDYEALLDGVIHTPAVFWRRRVFDKAGYLNEHLHYVLDNEFWMRAAAVATQTYIPVILANFHRRGGSKTEAAEAEFGPEMYHVFQSTFAQEPYQSQIPQEIQKQTLARAAWHAGVDLTLVNKNERARGYLEEALNKHHILDYPEIVAECVVVRYAQRDVLSRYETRQLIQQLPVSSEIKVRVQEMVNTRYAELRFHAAHNRRDWPEVRKSGWRVLLRNPQRLFKRGFMSIWMESYLGAQIAQKLRAWI